MEKQKYDSSGNPVLRWNSDSGRMTLVLRRRMSAGARDDARS